MPVDAENLLGDVGTPSPGEGGVPPAGPPASAAAGGESAPGTPAASAGDPGTLAPPPPSPADPTPAPAPGGSIRETLTSRGYDTSQFQSDQDALDGLLATAEEFHRTRPYVQVGQRYSPHAEAIDAYLEERSKPGAGQGSAAPQAPAASPAPSTGSASPPAPEKPPGLKWDPPEYDPAWETRARYDAESQRYVPASQYDSPVVADKLNTFRDWQAKTSRDLLTRFPDLVQEAMGGRMQSFEEGIEAKIQTAIRDAISGYDTQQQSSQFFSEREKELFEVDPQGRHLKDAATGEPVLSAKGRAFREYAEQGQAFGITDQANLLRYVDEQVQRDEAAGRFGQPPATPPGGNGSQPPPVTPDQRKGEFLRRVVRGQHVGQRSGTFPPPTSPADATQNPDETWDDIIADELGKRGLSPQTG